MARELKGLREALRTVAVAHPDKWIVLWFVDEARVGKKRHLSYRRWRRGQRPPGRRDRRFTWAYLFAAVDGRRGCACPDGSNNPDDHCVTGHVQPHLARGRPRRTGAGPRRWHGAKALKVPTNITPIPLPPYGPAYCRSYRMTYRS